MSVFVLLLSLAAVTPGFGADCNANGLDDACDLSCGAPSGPCDLPGCGLGADCDGNTVLDTCDLALGATGCPFPRALSGNTTGGAATIMLGAPDDLSWGIGGQIVTYHLDCGFLIDGPGPDLTVYEADTGGEEFTSVDVLVSADGLTFKSVKGSEGPVVRIPGDATHSTDTFARSYNLSAVGLPLVRYVRLDGNGTGAGGTSAGFDLDAVGLIHRLGIDCDTSGTLDACEGLLDCNGNGAPESCEFPLGLVPDCNTNGSSDVCEIQAAIATDCNANLIPDSCDVVGGASGCAFPLALRDNTTGGETGPLIGPPDDLWFGVGGRIITYRFDCGVVVNGPGADLNVYEVDGGGAEFASIDVLVSQDGAAFVSVKASEGPVVRIPGDGTHGDDTFARSYDLATAGLATASFVRIDGTGTGAGGPSVGFDLDAIGAIHRIGLDCNASGTPDACEAIVDCDGNDLPDACEVGVGSAPDCNANAIPDSCDIGGATSPDVNANGIPDECDPDCNGNDLPDDYDLAQGASLDCNNNALPDECDLAPGGRSVDCNLDSRPDECPLCGGVEVVFIMDTSSSMTDEGAVLCSTLTQVVADLEADLIAVDTELLAIAAPGTGIFSCLTQSVVSLYGTVVPGSPPAGNETLGACPGGNEVASEDWGRATSVVAGLRPWQPGTTRLIVPVADEGPWCGEPVSDPGVDRDAINHAIGQSLANGVIVSPVTGSGSTVAMIALADQLAAQTGGIRFASSVTADDLAAGIRSIVVEACASVSDCNGNNSPDTCDLGSLLSQDCNANNTPDECEADCNGNGVDDSCDIANATLSDLNSNGFPDTCERITLTLDAVNLNWTAIAGAIGYDAVKGDVRTLRTPTSGDFTASVTGCVAAIHPGLTFAHGAAPAAREANWYLVRAVFATEPLSYDNLGPGQVGLRDAEINAAAAACP